MIFKLKTDNIISTVNLMDITATKHKYGGVTKLYFCKSEGLRDLFMHFLFVSVCAQFRWEVVDILTHHDGRLPL